MKKIMAFLTVGGLISMLLFAKEGKKVEQDGVCEDIKHEIAQEQEKCDRVKDDPYEDLICERSQVKIRRRAKQLEECEGKQVDQKEFVNYQE